MKTQTRRGHGNAVMCRAALGEAWMLCANSGLRQVKILLPPPYKE